jgi:hypothetical protein
MAPSARLTTTSLREVKVLNTVQVVVAGSILAAILAF